jgi:hypothetical protein
LTCSALINASTFNAGDDSLISDFYPRENFRLLAETQV